MKNKFIMFIFIMLTVFMSSCSKENPSKNNGNTSVRESTGDIAMPVENGTQLKQAAVLKKSTNSLLDDVITEQYSQQDLLQYIYYNQSDNINTMLYRCDEKFPIECLERVYTTLQVRRIVL
jgi:hypothetical protein